MSNLRIVPVNHADAAVLTASSAALPVSQLQTTGRTDVWRASGTSATLTVTFPSPTTIDTVALMTSNFTPDAFWRIRVFNDVGGVLYDSTSILACPPKDISLVDWGYEALGVNAFAFGLSAQSVLWLPNRYVAHQVQIDLSNPTNFAGYIEASRLVIGARWSPTYNLSWGVNLSWEGGGKQSRAEDGSKRSEPGATWRKLGFSLDWLTEADRAVFAEMARRLNTATDFLISAYPGAGNYREEHYTLLGKFARAPGIAHPRLGYFSSNAVEIEEI